jgi:CRISPR-associated protein Cmr2
MTTHLLQITVGPVQDFIAQARRTRDLWYGSHLLSEVSRAVARWLARQRGVKLIFPALDPENPDDKAELEACIQPFREVERNVEGVLKKEKVAPLAVANIILAEIGNESRPAADLAAGAREEMQQFWKKAIADHAKSACEDLLATDVDTTPVWDEQIDSFLEFIGAWVETGDAPDTYRKARDRLNKAIAARKNLRDFEPWRHDRRGAPKSALDGARVSVLKDKEDRPPDLVRKYRLGDNEQLDAVGLVKRAGGETKASRQSHDLQFVPIINVALAPWIDLAKKSFPNEFSCVGGDLRKSKIDWPRVARNTACGRDLFGFDASLFLRNRWWPEFKELGELAPAEIFHEKDKAKREELERKWRDDVNDWCRSTLGPRRRISDPARILDLMGEPHPYVACLVADGDGMGKAIDALQSAEQHREFSCELSEFARQARNIVEGADHLGSLVYSGGDDVLGFLPVSTCLACAGELRMKFEEVMSDALKEGDGLKGGLEKLPTLSVGIGIGHVMESMGDLLALGRRAEKVAKGGSLENEKRRNALAVILDKRSGGTRQWRAQWSDWKPQEGAAGSGGPVARLQEDSGLLDMKTGTLSVRKVHQIGAILKRLPEAKTCASHEVPAFNLALISEVKRALRRSDRSQERLEPQHVGLSLDAAAYADNRKAVAVWIDRMLIARAIAESKPKTSAVVSVPEVAA